MYDLFGREKVFDIEDAGYVPKPEAKTFDLMVNKFGINPKETFLCCTLLCVLLTIHTDA